MTIEGVYLYEILDYPEPHEIRNKKRRKLRRKTKPGRR
jgi:hypothetical protein